MAKKKHSTDGRTAENRALDTFADLLIERLKTVQADWHKPWFSPNAMQWPCNMSGRKYNGGNAFMLMLLAQKEGYKIPVFGTFNSITSLNYTKQTDGSRKPALDANGDKKPMVIVKKGEHSFPVTLTTFSVIHKETREKIPFDDYKRLDEEARKAYNVYPNYSYFNVFNVCAQTNLQDARPELYQKLVEESYGAHPKVAEGERYSFPPLDAMIKHNGWVCPIIEHDGDAYYSLSQDSVFLPKRELFENGESFFTTANHELAHSVRVEGRLSDMTPERLADKERYAKEELVAEMSAALVCSNYGVEKTAKTDSLPYIKGWLKQLQESPDFIKTLINDIKQTSSVLIGRYDAIQERLDQGCDNPIPEQSVFERSDPFDEKKPTQRTDSERCNGRRGDGDGLLAAKALPAKTSEDHHQRGFHR